MKPIQKQIHPLFKSKNDNHVCCHDKESHKENMERKEQIPKSYDAIKNAIKKNNLFSGTLYIYKLR